MAIFSVSASPKRLCMDKYLYNRKAGPCVFPFKHGGKLVNSCLKAAATDNDAWCPVKVDSNSNPVQWVICDQYHCPTSGE